MMPMVRAPPLPSHVLAPLSAELRLELDMGGARSSAAVSALEPPRVVAELCVLSETAAIALRHSQFVAILLLADRVGRQATRHALRKCHRPALRPRRGGAAAAWWGYAGRAVGEQRRASGVHLRWDELRRRRDERRAYLTLYPAALASPQQPELQQALAELEAPLSLEDITHYRTLVRAPARATTHQAEALAAIETSLRGRKQATADADARADAARTKAESWAWIPHWLGGPKPAAPSPPPSSAGPSTERSERRPLPVTRGPTLEFDLRSSSPAPPPVTRGPTLEFDALSPPRSPTRPRGLSAADLDSIHQMLGLDAAAVAEGGGSDEDDESGEAGAAEEPAQYDPAYVMVRASAQVPALSAALYGMDGQGLVQVVLRGVSTALRLRPHRSGVGVQLTARTIELLHLDAPTPHLVHCLARAPGSEGDMLSIAVELMPLHSAAPLHMHAELRPMRLLFNPELLSCFLLFFILPPSHYGAGRELERAMHTKRRAVNSGLAGWLGGLVYDGTTRRHAPIHVSIHVQDVSILWVEPPHDNRTLSDPPAPCDASAAVAGAGRHLVWAEGAEQEPCVLPHTLLLRSDLISIESDPEPPQAAPGAPPAAPPGDHGFTFGGRSVRASLPPLIDPAAWLAGSDEAEACVAADGWCLQPMDAWVRVAGRLDLNGGARLPHVLMDIWMADGERGRARLRLREEQAALHPFTTPLTTPLTPPLTAPLTALLTAPFTAGGRSHRGDLLAGALPAAAPHRHGYAGAVAAARWQQIGLGRGVRGRHERRAAMGLVLCDHRQRRAVLCAQ